MAARKLARGKKLPPISQRKNVRTDARNVKAQGRAASLAEQANAKGLSRAARNRLANQALRVGSSGGH